jgi:hypothetical protein
MAIRADDPTTNSLGSHGKVVQESVVRSIREHALEVAVALGIRVYQARRSLHEVVVAKT